jgi:NADPH2:quinone reductase
MLAVLVGQYVDKSIAECLQEGIRVFETAEIERPEVKPGHVLIKVRHSSLNPVDIRIRRGRLSRFAPDLPAVLGCDVAGEVQEVGKHVKVLKEGDEVYGCAGGFKGLPGGALAEYLLADANLVARKRPDLPVSQAGALPTVGLTAYEALVLRCQLSAENRVLVQGGAGGVGHVAVQLAKSRSAEVYATFRSGPKALDAKSLIESLGAIPINSTEIPNVEEWKRRYTNSEGFDVVFDTVGDTCLQSSFAAVKPEGDVIAVAGRSTQDLTALHEKGATLRFFFAAGLLIDAGNMNRVSQNLSEMTKYSLRVALDPEQFDFFRVHEAHQKYEEGRAFGKIALRAKFS